jgi:uncharacterized membrane protein YgcG
MNGFIAKALAAVGLGGGLIGMSGCYGYRDVVDTCYPRRYEEMSRNEVQACFDPQVNNGHVLDQTVWNYHFEAGTDKLTPGGLEHLAYLARRRPSPDTKVWLQTAQDVPYDSANPNQLVQTRAGLDKRRVQAIEKFLTAQTAGRPMVFEVGIHDPAEAGISAIPADRTVQQMYNGYRGNLPTGAGAGGASASGGAGASSSGGGGASSTGSR